jgi:hypothetical protein
MVSSRHQPIIQEGYLSHWVSRFLPKEIPEIARWLLEIAWDLVISTSPHLSRWPFIIWKREIFLKLWADGDITTLTGYLRLQPSRSDLEIPVNTESHEILLFLIIHCNMQWRYSVDPINFSVHSIDVCISTKWHVPDLSGAFSFSSPASISSRRDLTSNGWWCIWEES